VGVICLREYLAEVTYFSDERCWLPLKNTAASSRESGVSDVFPCATPIPPAPQFVLSVSQNSAQLSHSVAFIVFARLRLSFRPPDKPKPLPQSLQNRLLHSLTRPLLDPIKTIAKSSSIANAQFLLQQWRESHGSCLTSTPSWFRYRNTSITTSHASSNLKYAVSQNALLPLRPSSGTTFHFGPRNPKSPLLPNGLPTPKPQDEKRRMNIGLTIWW